MTGGDKARDTAQIQKKRRSDWTKERTNDCSEILFEGDTTRLFNDKQKKNAQESNDGRNVKCKNNLILTKRYM
jgi:hypothetical protein